MSLQIVLHVSPTSYKRLKDVETTSYVYLERRIQNSVKHLRWWCWCSLQKKWRIQSPFFDFGLFFFLLCFVFKKSCSENLFNVLRKANPFSVRQHFQIWTFSKIFRKSQKYLLFPEKYLFLKEVFVYRN